MGYPEAKSQYYNKGAETQTVPFLYLPSGQSRDEILEDSGHRLEPREVGREHPATTALLLWPFSGDITAVTTQLVSMK